MTGFKNMLHDIADEAKPPVDTDGGINTMLTDMATFMSELGASELVGRRTAESFDVLDEYGMKLNPTKCSFGVSS